jgi:two-component system, NarL family, nitrate/nitrite response regulator NarL
MTIRVTLIDDHPFLLDTLQNLLRSADDITVVARCEAGSEELAAILDRQADVIVLDLRVPVMDGHAILRAINERQLGVRVVLLTGSADGTVPEAIRRLGVPAMTSGRTGTPQLPARIRTVTTSQPRPENLRMKQDGDAGTRESVDLTMRVGLTARELDIVRAIADGLRNRAIADKLRVTEGTVKVHLHNIYKKLGLRSRLALMIYTREHGLA